MNLNNFSPNTFDSNELDFNLNSSDIYEDPKLASYQCGILEDSIRNFQSTLDNESEVVLLLTSFGKEITMYVRSLGYSNPYLIHFYGFVNHKDAEIIQHMSQLNFLLTSASKLQIDKPAYRIGFNTCKTD